MVNMQRTGALCGNQVSKQKCFIVESIRDSTVWRKREPFRSIAQREEKGVVLIPSVVLTRSKKHHLPLFSTDIAAMEN